MKTLHVALVCLAACGLPLLAQNYQGNLDSASCSGIVGWAWNGTTSPINVDIYDGTVFLTTVLADQDTGNPDAYIGGRYYGFSIPLLAPLQDNQVHSIYARYGGTTINLGSDPRTLQCDTTTPGYQYYYTDTLQTINTSNWTQNGTLSILSGWGLSATTSTGGSLISKVAVQGPSSSKYEVNMTLALNASGGDYVAYVLATTNAITGTGSYFSVEIQNPTFGANGACSATLAAYQSVSGTVTQLLSRTVACYNGMQVRTVALGSLAYIIVDGEVMWATGITVASGMPGIGGRNMPSANAISLVKLGPWDNVAPSAVKANTFATNVTSSSVFGQWQGAVDNSNGVGVGLYAIERNDGAWFYSYDASFYDGTVQAGTTYTYSVIAQDYHANDSTASTFTITTPPAGAPDPRRVGVQPVGSYWGGAGEQIDLLSGNLNFSLPLIQAVGRGGLTANFNLSYNSQNWQGTGNFTELMGVDVGYGFGWQLVLGSILPVYSAAADLVPVQYYLFTDSSGAQYRLTQNNGNNVWSSAQTIYVWYDANANILHFRNGTFWVMGCTSAGGEPDAGTLYPTIVEDTNGNQIVVTYLTGAAASWDNSSARIMMIEDARAGPNCGVGPSLCSYRFAYTTGANGLSYLSSITTYAGTPENYSFTIDQGQAIYSPNGTSYGTTSLLAAVATTGLGYAYNLWYDTTLNDGDLLKVQFPQGGALGWAYSNFSYLGGETLRQVAGRSLQTTTPVYSYALTWPDANYSVSLHTGVALDDGTSGTEKYWYFNSSGGAYPGLVSELQYRSAPGVTSPLPRDDLYTWATDANGNFFVGTLLTTLNKGSSYAPQTQTVQTQDGYGNVATTSTYDYGNLTTPVRSYSNTYLYQGNTNYSSRYVYSRLATSTLTSASPNVTLVQNVYDGGTINTTATLPNEWDIVNYPASFIYRGNVTQANSPGKTTNTTYDYTGTVVSQNDNNGHSVNVATSTATNYTLPDTLSPNGSTTLQTQAQYTTAGYFPGSVAGPNQSIYNPTSAPNGTAAYTAYDTFGRVNLTLAPSQVAGQAAGAQTNYSYGYVSSAWTIKATTTNSSGSSHFTTTVLDGLGRTASVQTGTGSTTLSEVDTLYAPCACSPLGKMYQQTQPYAPPNSSPPATTYTYDALGRTVSVLLPDGASQTTYAYQGNFTTVTDPAGNWKQYATDALGNLVMVLEPDPTHSPVVGPPTPSTYPVTSAPTGTLLTTYTYDQFNHLTQVSMPRTTGYGLVTQTRTFAYASTAYASLTLPAVWLTSATNPESGTTSYTYNADGTLASKKDANGNTETYTYDAYQRLTGIPDRNQYFTYDTCPSGVTICANAPGQLMEAIFASGVGTNELGFTYGYAYTPAGKVASKSLMVQSANHLGGSVQASGTLTASYGYDGQGALVSQQYPISQTWASGTSNTFTYTLDALERPTQMTDSTQETWASGATYNAANQPLYDGTATRTYNNLLQMTSIVASGLNMTYNYSATKNNGQITSSVDGISGETITYAYDALKRLSGASSSASWSAGYTFDGYGNLLGIAGSGGPPSISLTAAVNASNVPTNQIQATGVTYDNNGNQTAGFGGLTFSYDAANRMTAVGGSASEAYWYDSSNLRVYSRSASGAETIYFYGADGTKLATYTYSVITYSGSPEIQLTQQSANVYFLGKLISAEGNAVQVDRLGSVRSGGPGGLGHQAEYPYGVEYSVTANDREKYATYTRDGVTGLDYAMNRYYASQWGRFLSPDRTRRSANLAAPQSWNRYAYALSDPVNGNDPTGLDGDDPCLAEDDGCDDPSGTEWYCSGDASAGTFTCTANPPPPDPDPPDPDPPDPEPPPDPPLPQPPAPPQPPPCPPQYQAWINAHGADATAAGLPEANALALTSIESSWGNGRFAQAPGNDYFNLETCWVSGTAQPALKYAYQSGWMQALQTTRACPGRGVRYMLVATYTSSLNSFLSAAATFSNLTATDPAKFAKNAVADGIYAGRSPAFFAREKTFANCLTGQ